MSLEMVSEKRSSGPARAPARAPGTERLLFARMGENHGPVLYRWVIARTGRASDAWDFVQDAFVRALCSRPEVKDDQELRAWLMVVIRNLLIDHHRSFAARLALAEGLEKIASPSPSEEPRWASIDIGQVRAALPHLHQGQRDVFELHAAGWKTAEIASHLGIPVCTVCTRLFRARRRLRALLADHLTGSEDTAGSC